MMGKIGVDRSEELKNNWKENDLENGKTETKVKPLSKESRWTVKYVSGHSGDCRRTRLSVLALRRSCLTQNRKEIVQSRSFYHSKEL